MSRKWYVIPSNEDAEMFAVAQDLRQYEPFRIDGYYVVADKLPIEDATFIAAAPELYEALREVMSWIAGWDPSFVEDREWTFTREKVDAAFKKAKGGGDE